jgi:hypothetical protein
MDSAKPTPEPNPDIYMNLLPVLDLDLDLLLPHTIKPRETGPFLG